MKRPSGFEFAVVIPSGLPQEPPILPLPADVMTQRLAFLAKPGAGKTHGAKKVAEGIHDLGGQFVTIDPAGVWWGVRLAKNGRSTGMKDVYVLGGKRGDLPLLPTSGRLIADLLVDRGISAILDVTRMTKGQRKVFAADFAEQFYKRKQDQDPASPVHLFLEEAQRFVPQQIFRGEGDERMLGAFIEMADQGRNYGIGITTISQRPQKVHKDVLNLTEFLVIMQMRGKQDRKSIQDWIEENDAEALQKVVNKGLARLQPGEAFVSSPSWLGIDLVKVKIGDIATFHSSKTPRLGERAQKAATLSKLDLRELESAMAQTIEEAKANDPRSLRQRVVELEAELAKRERHVAPVTVPRGKVEVRTQKIHILTAKDRRNIEKLAKQAESAARICDMLLPPLAGLRTDLQNLVKGVDDPRQKARESFEKWDEKEVERETKPWTPLARPHTPERIRQDHGGLPKGEAKILIAIAQHGAEGVTREQLTVITGYKRSTRDAYVQRLSEKKCVTTGARLIATPIGIGKLGSNYEPLPTGAELLKYYEQKLPEGEWKILDLLVAAYPNAVERESITCYKRSTRDAYLQRLTARMLVDTSAERGKVRASDRLFDRPRTMSGPMW